MTSPSDGEKTWPKEYETAMRGTPAFKVCIDCEELFTIWTRKIDQFRRCSGCATKIMQREFGTRIRE